VTNPGQGESVRIDQQLKRGVTIGLALGAALACAMFSGSAHADIPSRSFVVIPSECAQYWSIPGGPESPAGWNQVLSFAACIQDATVARIEHADELEDLVDELQLALEPALELYVAAVEQGPGPINIRATLQIAMAEAALITRARASIVSPPDLRTNAGAAARYRNLHERLEPLLEPQARFACMLIAAVDRAVAEEPGLAPDAVTRNLLAFARRVAAMLRRSWSILDDFEASELIAAPADEQGEPIWLDFMSSTRTWMRRTRGYDY
jgi:hypothetical protein